jgi:hypothetical protein
MDGFLYHDARSQNEALLRVLLVADECEGDQRSRKRQGCGDTSEPIRSRLMWIARILPSTRSSQVLLKSGQLASARFIATNAVRVRPYVGGSGVSVGSSAVWILIRKKPEELRLLRECIPDRLLLDQPMNAASKVPCD